MSARTILATASALDSKNNRDRDPQNQHSREDSGEADVCGSTASMYSFLQGIHSSLTKLEHDSFRVLNSQRA